MKPKRIIQRGREAWRVIIRRGGVVVRSIVRPTKQQAQQAATDWLVEREQYGAEGEVGLGERALLAHFKEVLTLAEIKVALDRAAKQKQAESRKVAEAVAAYEKDHGGEWSFSHRVNVHYRLGIFAGEFGERMVAELEPGQLASHIKARGGSASNQHRVIRAFIKWCRLQGWLHEDLFALITPPAAKAKTEEQQQEDKRVFSPAQMKALLAHADERTCTLLVLGGFAGLRYTECLRAKREHLDLERGLLHVQAMKTQKRGIRERWVNLPENATAWLRSIALPASGLLVGRNDKNARLQREAVLAELRSEGEEIEWGHNILRRSCASHHLAAYEDAAKTAAMLGHTSADTTYAKYYRALPQPQGLEWFAILPMTQ